MTATESHKIYLSKKNDKMKALKIISKRIFNVCHFYGIQVEANEELNCYVITGDVGFWTLKRLQEVAEECSMVISLVNSKLTITYIG